MTGRAAAPLLTIAFALLLGCGGELRFDDHHDGAVDEAAPDLAIDLSARFDEEPPADHAQPPDQSSAPPDAPGPITTPDPGDAGEPDAPQCAAVSCPFIADDDCNTSSCQMQCPSRQVCTGGCGGACHVECKENSVCNLTAGSNARVDCHESARCSVVLGPNGSTICRAGSRCDVRCIGSCMVMCTPGASCTLACGADEQGRAILDMQSCR